MMKALHLQLWLLRGKAVVLLEHHLQASLMYFGSSTLRAIIVAFYRQHRIHRTFGGDRGPPCLAMGT